MRELGRLPGGGTATVYDLNFRARTDAVTRLLVDTAVCRLRQREFVMRILHRFGRRITVVAALGGLVAGAIGAVATAPPAHAAEGVISIAAASITEGNAGVKTLEVAFSSSDARTVNCEVNWTLTDVTATNGTDYTPQAGQRLGLGAGAAFSDQLTTVLRVNGDTTVEGDETVQMTLVNDVDAELDCIIGGTTSVLLTITNDDSNAASTISVADAGFAEGDGNGHVESVIITSSPNPVSLSCEFNFALVDVTATIGSDYQLASAGGVMSAGQTTLSTSAVRIFGDTAFEGDETFTLRLVNDTDANLDCPIGDAEATITIVDDDTALPIRRMTIADTSLVEGDSGTSQMLFHLHLDGPANGDETVVLNTVDGTATAGSDFTGVTNQTFAFNAAIPIARLPSTSPATPASNRTRPSRWCRAIRPTSPSGYTTSARERSSTTTATRSTRQR